MRLLGWIAAACAVNTLAVAGPASSQDGSTFAWGRSASASTPSPAGVVQEVLERLGHRVEVTTGSHAQIFPKLGAGEVDLLVAAWLPHGHAVYWEQYGPRAEQLGVLYEGARFDWMVPTYIPQSEVASVADLKKPEVLARMQQTIQGTGRDSGNMILSAEVMQAYGLEEAGYRLQYGTLADFHGAYERAVAQQQWFVMPLWRPHYINRVGNMRAIDEPKGLLGPPSNGTLVASRQWVERAPQRTVEVLRRIQLGLDAVAEMDYRVNVDKLPRARGRACLDARQPGSRRGLVRRGVIRAAAMPRLIWLAGLALLAVLATAPRVGGSGPGRRSSRRRCGDGRGARGPARRSAAGLGGAHRLRSLRRIRARPAVQPGAHSRRP